MTKKWRRFSRIAILSLLGSLLLWGATAAPSHSHWDDLAVAEIAIAPTQAQVTLTFPTELVAFADDNGDGRLSPEEVRSHEASLERVLGEKIWIADSGRRGSMSVRPLETVAMSSSGETHTTLLLNYDWSEPVSNLQIHYGLFPPGASAASCRATIVRGTQVQSFTFTPKNRDFFLGEELSTLL